MPQLDLHFRDIVYGTALFDSFFKVSIQYLPEFDIISARPILRSGSNVWIFLR